MEPAVIRVVLADDEAVVRAGVAAVLASDPTITIVAEAGDGREAVDLTMRHRPEVVLMDVRMPTLDGLSAAEQLRDMSPDTAVVVLTTFGEDDYVDRALSIGVRGFLLKTSSPHELVAGVRAAAEGGACLAPRVARRLIAELSDPVRAQRAESARSRTAALTQRERDVLALLGAGLSNAQIARQLHLVEGTVKGHVSAILSRLGAGNRVQAAIIAYQAGLVPPSADP